MGNDARTAASGRKARRNISLWVRGLLTEDLRSAVEGAARTLGVTEHQFIGQAVVALYVDFKKLEGAGASAADHPGDPAIELLLTDLGISEDTGVYETYRLTRAERLCLEEMRLISGRDVQDLVALAALRTTHGLSSLPVVKDYFDRYNVESLGVRAHRTINAMGHTIGRLPKRDTARSATNISRSSPGRTLNVPLSDEQCNLLVTAQDAVEPQRNGNLSAPVRRIVLAWAAENVLAEGLELTAPGDPELCERIRPVQFLGAQAHAMEIFRGFFPSADDRCIGERALSDFFDYVEASGLPLKTVLARVPTEAQSTARLLEISEDKIVSDSPAPAIQAPVNEPLVPEYTFLQACVQLARAREQEIDCNLARVATQIRSRSHAPTRTGGTSVASTRTHSRSIEPEVHIDVVNGRVRSLSIGADPSSASDAELKAAARQVGRAEERLYNLLDWAARDIEPAAFFRDIYSTDRAVGYRRAMGAIRLFEAEAGIPWRAYDITFDSPVTRDAHSCVTEIVASHLQEKARPELPDISTSGIQML